MVTPEFYKYASSEVARIIVETGKLRWSSPKILNDPAEFRLAPIGLERRDRLLQLSLEESWTVASGEVAPVTPYGRTLRALCQKLGWTQSQFLENYRDPITESVDIYIQNEPARIAEIHQQMERDKILCLTDRYDNPTMWANLFGGRAGTKCGF